MVAQALSGIKVLDLTHYIAGPYCTKLLADYGAEVIKVERPLAGDGARRMGPFPKDQPHLEKSGLFLHLNTNKLGVTLNLKTPTGASIFKELTKWADILVESFSPGVMAKLGLAYEGLAAINPGLVVTSISSFGQAGPYRDFRGTEIVAFAMGGPMHETGIAEMEPVKYGDTVALYQAGLMAAVATMMAFMMAEDRGIGEHVDVSIMDTQAGTQDRRTTRLMASQFTGEAFPRPAMGAAIATGTWPCKDGYFNLTGSGPRFPRVLRMMNRLDLMEDPRFANITQWSRPESAVVFNQDYLLPWLMERTKKEVWERAQAAGVLSAPIFTPEDLVRDEHYGERGVWAEVEHPAMGGVTIPGRPFIMYDTPWSLRRPAPLLGQHNQVVFCGMLGYSKRDLLLLRQGGII